MTEPERMLWALLRGKRVGGLRFRNQHAIGPYILDFYCAASKLAVEVDGPVHDEPDQAEHDRRRSEWLAKQNIRVLRFTAEDVKADKNLVRILATIVDAAAPSTGSAGSPPP